MQLISSAGAAQDGLDVTDVVACEVLGVRCAGGRATWSRYTRGRTYETKFDAVAHSAAVALPTLLRDARCSRRHGAGRSLQAAAGASALLGEPTGGRGGRGGQKEPCLGT